jgi:hypothetical protein
MKKKSEGDFEMIEKIPDLPNNIHGFAAKGTITAYDYRSSSFQRWRNCFLVRRRFG